MTELVIVGRTVRVIFPRPKWAVSYSCFSTRFYWCGKCSLLRSKEWVHISYTQPCKQNAESSSSHHCLQAFAAGVALLSLFLLFSMSAISNSFHVLQFWYACGGVCLSTPFSEAVMQKLERDQQKITHTLQSYDGHRAFCAENWSSLGLKNYLKRLSGLTFLLENLTEKSAERQMFASFFFK